MKKLLLALSPLLVIALGIAGAAALVKSKKKVVKEIPPVALRTVECVTATKESTRYRVASYGTVMPRTETSLVSEVTGRVVAVHPSFVTGGFFEKGEVLLEIDRSIYEAELARWQAELAGVKAALDLEKAQAVLAVREWETFGEGEPSDLVLRKPQLAEAEARVQSAQANLRRAEIDLARTRVQAPYAGRIRERFANQGQYLVAGTPVARIYSSDVAEVRLPITQDDVAYFALPLGRQLGPDDVAPAVELRAEVAGEVHRWQGRIVRTEAEVDPASRVIYAVAQVAGPYGNSSDGETSHPPLLVGTFVQAEIVGHEVEGVSVLPRRALRPGSVLHIVDSDGRLRIRKVRVLKLGANDVVVGDLAGGERVCLTDLDVAIDGMSVRVATDAAPSAISRAKATREEGR